MKAAYCPHCNTKHTYQLSMPKFCSHCGESMTSFKKKEALKTTTKQTPNPAPPQKKKTVVVRKPPSFARAAQIEEEDYEEEIESDEVYSELQETDVLEVPEVDDDFADSFSFSCSFAGRRVGKLKVEDGRLINV